MAEFCRQCATRIDREALAMRMEEARKRGETAGAHYGLWYTKAPPGKLMQELCEGCGWCMVDEEGNCQTHEHGITCPHCGATSHNPNDIREGYCGRCHDWTAP